MREDHLGGENKKREMTEYLEEEEGRSNYRLDLSFLVSKMGAYTAIPQTFLDCQFCSGSCIGWSQWRHCSGSEEEDCTSWPWITDAERMAVAAWTIQDGRGPWANVSWVLLRAGAQEGFSKKGMVKRNQWAISERKWEDEGKCSQWLINELSMAVSVHLAFSFSVTQNPWPTNDPCPH